MADDRAAASWREMLQEGKVKRAPSSDPPHRHHQLSCQVKRSEAPSAVRVSRISNPSRHRNIHHSFPSHLDHPPQILSTTSRLLFARQHFLQVTSTSTASSCRHTRSASPKHNTHQLPTHITRAMDRLSRMLAAAQGMSGGGGGQAQVRH